MASADIGASILRFGAFELDLRTNELRRAGLLIKLAPQQSRILRYLAERAGEVCTRDEIQREIWGHETFVDFDRSLNVSIAQIRSALNDDSEAPRFIQTVPRRGYRFVAPVEASCAGPTAAAPNPHRTHRASLAIAAGVLTLAMAAGGYFLATRNAGARAMLAVLPFENLTHLEEDARTLDGLADELITQFGSLQPERLGVIGRTSVMRYQTLKPAIPQLVRDLNVQYVIEGSVRHEGDRLRVSVRLVSTRDQSQIWSETYEQDAASRLEIEEQIAAKVTVAVAQQVFGRTPPAPTRVANPAAYDAYMKGRYLLHKANRGDTARAIEEFDQAANLDRNFAAPLAAKAETYVGLALSGQQAPQQALMKAREAAQRALEINEADAGAHNAIADVLFWNDWDWSEARRHFERALAINPSQAQTHHDYAIYQVVMGHPEAGVVELRRAIAIDPLSPRVNVDAGWVLLQAHHFEEAIKQAKRALELEPHLMEATACIERARQYQGTADAQTRAFFEARRNDPLTTPYNKALANAALGHQDEALSNLEAACERRELAVVLMNTEPTFTPLRANARFVNLVKRLKLPQGF